MFAYLVRRIATIIPTLIFVSMLIFGLQQLLPGDPAVVLAGEDRDPNVVLYLREHVGQNFKVDTLAGDVRALWDSGFFEDVQVDLTPTDRGVRLRFKVTEQTANRIIVEVLVAPTSAPARSNSAPADCATWSSRYSCCNWCMAATMTHCTSPRRWMR